MATAYPTEILKLESTAPPCEVRTLADTAVWALIEEAELTPKPGLVDRRGSGAHNDMNLAMLRRSATALRPTFLELARAAHSIELSAELRELLGAIGRQGEATMMRTTAGCNTHRGAIWTLGLLCASAANLASSFAQRSLTAASICHRAASIALLPDSNKERAFAPQGASHGTRAFQLYGVHGARGEAQCGFPHVVDCAIPALHAARAAGVTENAARMNALLAIMTTLDDTCLLHRGGPPALRKAQLGATCVLHSGGAATAAGMHALLDLDRELIALNSSPGGSADLFAAALFLDRLTGGK
jgi:triphosphoribosyl-dephospho-CoA synthase